MTHEWIATKEKPGTPCRVQSNRDRPPCSHWKLCFHLITTDLTWREDFSWAQMKLSRVRLDRRRVWPSSPTQKHICSNTSSLRAVTKACVCNTTKTWKTRRGTWMNVRLRRPVYQKAVYFCWIKERGAPRPLRTRLPASSTYRNTKTSSETISRLQSLHSLGLTKPTRSCWMRGVVGKWLGGQITWELDGAAPGSSSGNRQADYSVGDVESLSLSLLLLLLHLPVRQVWPASRSDVLQK